MRFWLRSSDNKEMLYVNRAYEQVWERSCQSLYENPGAFIESVHPEDRTRVLQAYSAYLEDYEFDMTYRIQVRNGAIKWIHARSFPITDHQGLVVGHTGMAIDVTDKMDKRKTILDQEANFQDFFHFLQDYILICDLKGQIIEGNKALLQLMGLTKDDLKDKSYKDFFLEKYHKK